jgi:hypothetical protein
VIRRNEISGDMEMLTVIVSEDWAMDLGRTSTSWDSELNKDTASGYGLESTQALCCIGKPDLERYR